MALNKPCGICGCVSGCIHGPAGNGSPTGRVYKPEPEIQNLPGTPAAKLEMAYAKYGRAAFTAETNKAFNDMLVTGHGFMRDGKRVDPAEVLKLSIDFPCQIKFTIHPYVGMPRSAVWVCPDQAEVDRLVAFYMSDTTGNTEHVVYSVYVEPEVKPCT